LATGSLTVIRFIPILTAAILLVSAAMIRRLPGAAAQPAESHAHTEIRLASESELPSEIQPADAPPPAVAVAVAVAPGVPPGRPAIRNAGFVVTSFFDGLLSSHQTLLLATTLHAAGWLIIAAIVVTAAAGIRPCARTAQRYLEEGPGAPQPVPAAAE
jgi:hypothetical protein